MPGKKSFSFDPQYYKYAVFILVFVIVATLAGAKFVANSTSITAMSRLYPVKLFAENTILSLAEPDDRAKIEAYQLKQRVVELRSLELRLSSSRSVDMTTLQQAIANTRKTAGETLKTIENDLQFIKSSALRAVIEDEVGLSKVELAQ